MRIASVRLAALVDAMPGAYRDVEVESVVADSRAAGPGALYAAELRAALNR